MDTVPGETPACAATCLMPTVRRGGAERPVTSAPNLCAPESSAAVSPLTLGHSIKTCQPEEGVHQARNRTAGPGRERIPNFTDPCGYGLSAASGSGGGTFPS
ncbi:hypothetical protein GCM10010187_53920 [Actinomadura coerulea]|nr:hypothetical protein GCM10010187_53920 [Actinomadura coerulea]